MSEDVNNKIPCFPMDKMDDMILFGMIFLLILFSGWRGHWNLVESMSNNLIGAILMYIKGNSNVT